MKFSRNKKHKHKLNNLKKKKIKKFINKNAEYLALAENNKVSNLENISDLEDIQFQVNFSGIFFIFEAFCLQRICNG